MPIPPLPALSSPFYAGAEAASIASKLENLLLEAKTRPQDVPQLLDSLRQLILTQGIPFGEEFLSRPSHSICSLRGKIWKILLGVGRASATDYITLVEMEKSSVYNKIRNDTFRTLTTDHAFRKVVAEDELIRVLNAFAHYCSSSSFDTVLELEETRREELKLVQYRGLQFSYVQGMNVLLAPILYCMPELDAFYTFKHLLLHHIPMYVQPAMEGVHSGCFLVSEILKYVDQELHLFLGNKGLDAKIYAFGTVLTLSNCTPPLSELLQLWDFLFAFGVHLNVVCCVAQLILMKTPLMNSATPTKYLRTYPPLKAKAIIYTTIEILQQLSSELHGLLQSHAQHVLQEFANK